jgi:hypothetical protein
MYSTNKNPFKVLPPCYLFCNKSFACIICILCIGFEDNSCKITSLDEFWNYTIEVTASTDKGSSISETCFNQTKEDGKIIVILLDV